MLVSMSGEELGALDDLLEDVYWAGVDGDAEGAVGIARAICLFLVAWLRHIER